MTGAAAHASAKICFIDMFWQPCVVILAAIGDNIPWLLSPIIAIAYRHTRKPGHDLGTAPKLCMKLISQGQMMRCVLLIACSSSALEFTVPARDGYKLSIITSANTKIDLNEREAANGSRAKSR